MTKGELQAFSLVVELLRQMNPHDRLMVWDDFSPKDWVEQMVQALRCVRPQTAFLFQDAVNNHFGEHRNRAKQHFPNGEWIFMVDADEWIQDGLISGLNEIISEDGETDAIFLERQNTFWQDTGTLVPPGRDESSPSEFQGRAFLNYPWIRFERHVHEGIVGFLHPRYLKGGPFCLIHHKLNATPRYALTIPGYADYIASFQK